VTVAVTESAAAALLSPQAVRERCGNIAAAIEAGRPAHWRIAGV